MYDIGLITTSNEDEAEKISEYLVTNNLIACANIIPKIKSIYKWKGKVEKDSESLIIFKTKKDLRNDILKHIKKIHTYETPECVFIPISDGLKEYLDWIDESLITE
ncbi:MAG: divalent-cation tolerance protein CutA [Candidatus Helarchaeota archaeon]